MFFFFIYSLCARKMPFSVKWALCIFKQITGAGRGTDPNNLTQCSGCCRMLRKNTGSQTRAQAPLLYYRFVTHIGRLLITRCLKLVGVMPMTLASSPATKHTQKLLCLGKLEVPLEIAVAWQHTSLSVQHQPSKYFTANNGHV